MRLARITPALLLVLAGACKSAAPQEEVDRTAYLEHMPRSILVIPPLDETLVADAPYGWLATATRPLSEMGYYVFPVALVNGMMRDNGLPTPGEMNQVSLSKIDEIFGADAVLYVDIQEWGTSYKVLESESAIALEARLVDVKSGTELWKGSQRASRSSNESSQGGLAGMLAGAIAHSLVSSASDPMPDLARGANRLLFGDKLTGLMVGPRHPAFDSEVKRHRDKAPATGANAPATGVNSPTTGAK